MEYSLKWKYEFPDHLLPPPRLALAGIWLEYPQGALPVAVSYGIYWLADRKLPNPHFVYIFLNAFFGGALLLQLSGAYLYHDYPPYFILMTWSEAVTTGMAITLMAVYRPLWLSTFDDMR